MASDCAGHLREESGHTEAYSLDAGRLEDALVSLETEFLSSGPDLKLLNEAAAKSLVRTSRRSEMYTAMVLVPSSLSLELANLELPGGVDPRSRNATEDACRSRGRVPTSVSDVPFQVEICPNCNAFSVFSPTPRCCCTSGGRSVFP